MRWIWDKLGPIFRLKTICDLTGLSGAEWWRTPLLGAAGAISGWIGWLGHLPLWAWFLIMLAAPVLVLSGIEHLRRFRIQFTKETFAQQDEVAPQASHPFRAIISAIVTIGLIGGVAYLTITNKKKEMVENPPKGPTGTVPSGTNSSAQPEIKSKKAPNVPPPPTVSSKSGNAVGTFTNQPGAAATFGANSPAIGTLNINKDLDPNPVVPEVVLGTNNGLALADFPDSTISPEMMRHLSRRNLSIRNTNATDLHDLKMRFQLPEPIVGKLVVEDRPSGVEITWHACRVSFSLVGEGASAAPAGRGVQISTGPTPGFMATFQGGAEVCSEAMNNEKRLTGIYELRIARLPAATGIRLAFLTTNGPDGQDYLGINSDDKPIVLPKSLLYYGDGTYQYSYGTHVETRPIFVELRFDPRTRSISSLPSSGERGNWKITRMVSN